MFAKEKFLLSSRDFIKKKENPKEPPTKNREHPTDKTPLPCAYRYWAVCYNIVFF